MTNSADLEISGADVQTQLDRAGHGFVLLDIRETYELDRGILPGAVHLPMSQIEARHTELQTDREIICYCEHGVRSYNVAAWLQSQGYQSRSMAGGFADWAGPRVPFSA